MSENLNLTDQLAQLHEAYVVAVNEAVAADDMIVVDELARDFDRESMELITHHQAPAA
jgi:nucleoside-triphosphatase THEP1